MTMPAGSEPAGITLLDTNQQKQYLSVRKTQSNVL